MFPFYTIKRPHNIAVIVILLRKNSIVVIAFTEQLILSFFMLFDLGKMHRISILTFPVISAKHHFSCTLCAVICHEETIDKNGCISPDDIYGRALLWLHSLGLSILTDPLRRH